MEKNEKKYDISKSNFFANIPENNDIQNKSEIKNESIENLNTPISNNINPQYSQNNYISNINNINNINNISNSNFYPPQSYPNFYSQYPMNSQYQNDSLYQNNINYYPGQNQPQTQSTSFFQKVSESAMNLIKKEDPLNLITDIDPKSYDDMIKKSKKEIDCQILEKSKISDTEIKSIISNPRKISDSLVKNSYLLYDITTPKMNWFVNRRYSDFIWLRETLVSLFPTILMPQLPKKKIGNRRFEEDFIQKRMNGLQKFLDEVLKNEILKTADPLISFLSFSERGFFEQQMKIITPKNMNFDTIMGIKSFSGKIEVADMENEQLNDSQNYFNTVENFFNSQEEELKNIKNNLNQFSICMIQACKHLEQMENVKNFKRIHINQSSIIRTKLNECFKYIKNNGLSLIELIKKQNDIQNEYKQIKEDLLNKKEGYWKKMDITKWEMNPMAQIDSALLFRDKSYAFSKMCFQETIKVNAKGDLLGYFYMNNIINVKNVLDNIAKFSVENLVNFSKEIEPTVTDVVNVWSNLASNL